MCTSGSAISPAHSFSILFVIKSGPGNFQGFNDFNFFSTSRLVTGSNEKVALIVGALTTGEIESPTADMVVH